MPELWETDVRVFLTLTGLARRATEYHEGRMQSGPYEEALRRARIHYPSLTHDQVMELARKVERFRNESICKVALKVPPFRKITSRDFLTDDLFRVTMDCGHERKLKAKDFQRMTQCSECLRTERAEIAQNVRPVSKRK